MADKNDWHVFRKVAEAAQQARIALQQRDAAIRTAVDAGHSLRSVARAAGMTDRGIARVLSRGPRPRW